MDTLRPVKKLDSAGSLRASSDFMGSKAPTSPTSGGATHVRHASEHQRAGSAMVSEVIVPTIQLAIRDDMDAREIEALSMLSKGFEDLREANSELAYNLVLDILAGINECVFPCFRVLRPRVLMGGFAAIKLYDSISRPLVDCSHTGEYAETPR